MTTFVNKLYNVIVWPCDPFPSGAKSGLLPTGGSYAKSPIRITNMQPNGTSRCVDAWRNLLSTHTIMFLPSIDTSSIQLTYFLQFMLQAV